MQTATTKPSAESQDVEMTYTENGALSLSSTGSACLNLFFKSVRRISQNDLINYLEAAWTECPLATLKIIFYNRDCRGGKGERKIFHESINWLISKNLEKHFLVNMESVVTDFGRWEDLLEHINTPSEAVNNAVAEMFAKQLKQDLLDMNEAKSISLCAKWAPTENGKHDKKFHAVKRILTALNCNYADYRKRYLSPLREYLNIVERLMCAKKWVEINYNKVPSRAMAKLRKAFQKNDTKRFEEWMGKLKTGEAKVNSSVVEPHEMVRQYLRGESEHTVVEEQWNGIKERVSKLGVMKKSIALSDVSGSMNGEPMEVSIALGILIADLTQAPYNGLVITFHENPTFFELKGRSLKDKVTSLSSAPWGGSTNFQAAFDLILEKAKKCKLPQDQMPEKLYVISDMQFNQADSRTNFQAIKDKYASAGYAMPQIIFWNVRAGTTDFTNTAFESNVAMVSGFSPSILKAVLEGKDFSPIGIMKTAIEDKRYEKVVLAQ